MFNSVFNEVVTREYQPRNRYTFSRRKCIPLIGVSNFECQKNQAFYLHSCIDATSPPFDCDFSLRSPNLLLVAKEDGLVHLFDTEQHGSESLLRYYGVHDNAIFSVKWVTYVNQFLTASGDQTIKLVDSETGLVVSVYVGHTMSVRSLALCPENHYIFASASRDGSIRLWDMRTHNLEGTDSQSVTSIVFAREFELISAGSTDGAIKIWDIRKVSFTKKQPQPITSLPYNGTSRKQCGYSDLVLDSSRRRLYASCLDHTVYEYDLTSVSTRPVLPYTGHLTGSFYIKLSLSPDNAYLACGSADSRAYIYRVGARTQRPLVLSGHTGEVSVPRWSFHDPTCVVTLSDTAQLFVWRMFPAREYTMPEPGELMGLTECLSQPTVNDEHQRSLLVPDSVRSTTVISSTKSLPISSESSGGAFCSSSLLARRRRQLNIRDFLMDLPQAGDMNGSNLINNNSISCDNTRSSILSTISKRAITNAAVAVATSSSPPPSSSMPCECNSNANIPIQKWDEDIENNPPSSSSTSTDSHSHHRALRQCYNYRHLNSPGSTGQEGRSLPLSDITTKLSQSSRKRPIKVDDRNGNEMEDYETSIGSQSPTWSKHSTTAGVSFSASSSVSVGTRSPRGTPRRRRRTTDYAASASTSLPSISNRSRRRSTLRPAVVAPRRNSIRNYFKPSEE
ncbi:hypothetical protein TcWFU_005319 [Taenia crassiceps]|uniref:Denticleless protein n=1 Tax=Taenia crassiceps TaxID=6207 RepID=A0ABR4QGN1_9CEST